MLTSRGWVYATAQAASKSKKTGKSFHTGCDRQIVPAFGNTTPTIDGFEPEIYKTRYDAAVDSLKEKFPPELGIAFDER